MVHGIQRLSGQPTKNAADIALAIDALADFMAGATQFVAVMSDDSDFIALYAKLRLLAEGNAPFLWVLTARPGTRSTTIRDYFPNDHIHVVRAPVTGGAVQASSAMPGPSDDAEQPSEAFAADGRSDYPRTTSRSVQRAWVASRSSRNAGRTIQWRDMPGPKFGTGIRQRNLALAGKSAGVKTKVGH